MVCAATLAWVLELQQLRVSPVPAAVGAEVVVQARRGEAPIPGLEIHVELPGGTQRACGRTGADGRLAFNPDVAGHHVFVAVIDGVRTLAPVSVVAARPRWLLAVATVPLGLALLWWNLNRVRGRRAP